MANDSAAVLIIPAGKGAAEQAERFGYYHCKNRRSFRAFEYIAFYSKNRIIGFAVVNEGPEHDVIMSERPELSALAEHTRMTNGNPSELHSLYRLTKFQRLNISNDKMGSNTSPVCNGFVW
jgi:hypothetical protein